jgi:hypothetical protein
MESGWKAAIRMAIRFRRLRRTSPAAPRSSPTTASSSTAPAPTWSPSRDAHVEWFQGNFDDYEADKIRRLGPDAVESKRIKYKKFAR